MRIHVLSTGTDAVRVDEWFIALYGNSGQTRHYGKHLLTVCVRAPMGYKVLSPVRRSATLDCTENVCNRHAACTTSVQLYDCIRLLRMLLQTLL
jgi:hypothetical protein